jgi:hypothetical protein
MTIQRNLISATLMATALAVASLPLIATACNSAQAAGVSQERHGKRFHAKKRGRRATVRQKRYNARNASRFARKKTRKSQKRYHTVRPSRPAVTMPKTVVTAKPRPYARPAVTTPKTVIGGNTAVDPTAGRINNREQATKQAAYQQCASFSLRVHQGCYSQAQGNPQKQKACRTHYQGNTVRCQGQL